MKPKILLIADRPKWAYEAIARGLIAYLSRQYDFELKYAKDLDVINAEHDQWDLIFSIGWKYPKREITTPREKTISSIQSHRTLDGAETDHWVEYLDKRYCAVGVSNEKLHDTFLDRIPDLVLTPNGVDTRKFAPDYSRVPRDKMILGWVGRSSQAEFRGLDLIQTAANAEGWVLRVQDADASRRPPGNMPGFYNSIDCYINASESEGCSISVLEACSCGRPLLATMTGAAPVLVKEGETGYSIERNVSSISTALRKLSKAECRWMGSNMRSSVLKDWDWSTQAKNYGRLIELGLNGGAEKGGVR